MEFQFPPAPKNNKSETVYIAAANAIIAFRKATGATYGESKASFDASFKDTKPTLETFAEWVKAYYAQGKRHPYSQSGIVEIVSAVNNSVRRVPVSYYVDLKDDSTIHCRTGDGTTFSTHAKSLLKVNHAYTQ